MWKEGHWKLTVLGQVMKTLVLVGDELREEDGTLWMKLTFRPSGSSHKIENVSSNLDFYWAFLQRDGYGVVLNNGKKIILDTNDTLDWISEEEYNIMNEKDPADDIPNSYQPKPDQIGKILWLCGSTGMGKTTTAKILQAEKGFVYYEGDCFVFGFNPYVGAAPEGFTQFGTKALSGIPQERTKVVNTALTDGYTKLFKGEAVAEKVWEDFYELLCQDILRERGKLGGDWVIAQAAYTRTARDIIRRKMGGDLILVVLETEQESLQIERLARRAANKEEMTEEELESSKNMVKGYVGCHDTVQEDEPNTFKVMVTADMTAADVANIVLEKFRKQV